MKFLEDNLTAPNLIELAENKGVKTILASFKDDYNTGDESLINQFFKLVIQGRYIF
jgi:uncharacterized protein with ParB-like and HNH nuclease domain